MSGGRSLTGFALIGGFPAALLLPRRCFIERERSANAEAAVSALPTLPLQVSVTITMY